MEPKLTYQIDGKKIAAELQETALAVSVSGIGAQVKADLAYDAIVLDDVARMAELYTDLEIWCKQMHAAINAVQKLAYYIDLRRNINANKIKNDSDD